MKKLPIAILFASLVPGCSRPSPASFPPNLVLLLADDLGYGDLGCFGHPTLQTPRLDSMAQQGIRLTSFYAAPACSPARAALLTGRYPPRAGVPHVLGPDSPEGLPPDLTTLAEALRARNYRTTAVGKWHLGTRAPFLPTAQGFDEYFGLLYSNDMQPPWVQTERPLHLYRNDQPVEHPVQQATLTERYTEETLRFIRRSREHPFFLYLAYTMPHVPLHASERFRGRSRNGLYGDVVEEIDWSVGRILDTLREEGLEERTLVVFTSDNGPWLHMPERMFSEGIVQPWHAGSPGPLRGWKGSTYEGGVRVPLVARWPGRIPAGRVSAEPAALMDLYPTFLQLAGAEIPDAGELDGKDILPLLEGTGSSPHPHLYYFRGRYLEGVRKGPWKLRVSPHLREDVPEGETPSPELFHLEVDPGERYNRAAEHPALVQELLEEMRTFARKSETPLFFQ